MKHTTCNSADQCLNEPNTGTNAIAIFGKNDSETHAEKWDSGWYRIETGPTSPVVTVKNMEDMYI